MKFLHKRLFAPILIALLALQGCGSKSQTEDKVGSSSEEFVGNAPGEPGSNGRDGKDGIDGRDGKDGIDGTDGKDGADGKPGGKGETGEIGPKGEKGEPGVGMQGPSGQDGKDGVGIPGPPGKDAAAASTTLGEMITTIGELLNTTPTTRRAEDWMVYYQLQHLFGRSYFNDVYGSATICGYAYQAAAIGSFNASENRVIYNDEDKAVGTYFGGGLYEGSTADGDFFLDEYHSIRVLAYGRTVRIKSTHPNITKYLAISDKWGAKLIDTGLDMWLDTDTGLLVSARGGSTAATGCALIIVVEESGELLIA